jgi:hypothetical protein
VSAGSRLGVVSRRLGRVLIKTDDSSAIVDRCLLSSYKRRKSGHFLTAASCQDPTGRPFRPLFYAIRAQRTYQSDL